MELEQRKRFLINCLYLALLIFFAFAGARYLLPLLAPFVIAFLLSAVLQRPIRRLSGLTGISRGICAILVVLLFYSTIGLLFTLLCLKLISTLQGMMTLLPSFYNESILPTLFSLMDWLNQLFSRMDPSVVQTLNDLLYQAIESLGSSVSTLSVVALSSLSGWASSLPGFFIKLLLMVISTFFVAKDYDMLAGFVLRQFTGRGRELLLHIRQYLVGTLWICIRSYLIIMSITFVELSFSLSLLRIDHAILIALCIAIFDILPVLGTGGIMVPWALLTAIHGNYRLAIGLGVVYVVVTIIRNIIEPKIVGSQLGLHPVVILAAMFVGTRWFGFLGLFGLPIALSLLRNLNESGDIHLFR